ncbi:MAG TPA: mechanosensitive ion channel domain-containing protein [Longimicrobiales bacterium]|nr:mechanosensitive ion channel domain-containing protein [Longimicrobiales bacterium]
MRRRRGRVPRPSPRRPGDRRPGRYSSQRAESAARSRLRGFRHASKLAIGATALALLLVGTPGGADADPGTAGAAAGPATLAPPAVQEGAGGVQEPAGDPRPPDTTEAEDTASADPGESARRATGTLRSLARGFYGYLPILGIALAILLFAGVLARLTRVGLRTVLASWERADAIAALVAILIWLMALGATLSVLAGDARALVGSLGLFGLALSWALQTPIESFTGWLLNSFRSYYRVGDRIEVGGVFGDVAGIDFLTTTVFEAGGADKRVGAAQATGALITFPNYEVLRSNIVNYTRDFPYVWDELTVGVANESDLPTAMRVLQETAAELVGDRMRGAVEEYAAILERQRLAWDVSGEPEVYASPRESWTDLTIRYLVPAREVRRWSSRLLLATTAALEQEDVRDRVFAAYPRSQVQRIRPPGRT